MENCYEGKRSVRAGEAISIFLKANSLGSARIILGKDRFPLVPLISSATFRHDWLPSDPPLPPPFNPLSPLSSTFTRSSFSYLLGNYDKEWPQDALLFVLGFRTRSTRWDVERPRVSITCWQCWLFPLETSPDQSNVVCLPILRRSFFFSRFVARLVPAAIDVCLLF